MPRVDDHTIFLHLDEFLIPQFSAPLGQLQILTSETRRNDFLPFQQKLCCLLNILMLTVK